MVLELAESSSADVVHNLSGEWQRQGEFSTCGAIRTLEHSQHIYIDFATAKQAAAAAHKFNEGVVMRYLDTHVIARAVVKSSFDKRQLSHDAYAADRLLPVDEAYYRSAGLLCLRRSCNGDVKVLLGRQHGQLTLLGGKRNRGESSCLTALRDFSEETSYQLDIAVVAQLMPHASVIWVAGAESNAKYAMYILDLDSSCADSDSTVPSAVYQQFHGLCAKFAEFRNSPGWRKLPTSQREMHGLEWVSLDARSVLGVNTSNCSPFLFKLMAECHPLQQWAAYTVQHAAGQGQPATPLGMLQPAAHTHTTSSWPPTSLEVSLISLKDMTVGGSSMSDQVRTPSPALFGARATSVEGYGVDKQASQGFSTDAEQHTVKVTTSDTNDTQLDQTGVCCI